MFLWLLWLFDLYIFVYIRVYFTSIDTNPKHKQTRTCAFYFGDLSLISVVDKKNKTALREKEIIFPLQLWARRRSGIVRFATSVFPQNLWVQNIFSSPYLGYTCPPSDFPESEGTPAFADASQNSKSPTAKSRHCGSVGFKTFLITSDSAWFLYILLIPFPLYREHFCFLCQKSLFFNAWADHLLDRGHRQRVFAMKAEENQQQAALHALAARSAWNPLLGADPSLSRSGSTASLGESRYSTAPESFLSSDGHHSDVDWKLPVHHFDRETERLIQRTQLLLKKRQADKGRMLAKATPEEEEEDMTPVTSLLATERSDWPDAGCFDATPSTSSSCTSRTRARRR